MELAFLVWSPALFLPPNSAKFATFFPTAAVSDNCTIRRIRLNVEAFLGTPGLHNNRKPCAPADQKEGSDRDEQTNNDEQKKSAHPRY